MSLGDLVKLGVASVEEELPPSLALDQLSRSLNSMLPYLLVRKPLSCLDPPMFLFFAVL